MFSKHHRLPHILTTSGGPLSHLIALDCLLLERIMTGSLSRGRHRLLVGGEVNFGNLGSWVWPLRPFWPHWICMHDLIGTRLAIRVPKLALLSAVIAASPSKAVLEYVILMEVRSSIQRLMWRDNWYGACNCLLYCDSRLSRQTTGRYSSYWKVKPPQPLPQVRLSVGVRLSFCQVHTTPVVEGLSRVGMQTAVACAN